MTAIDGTFKCKGMKEIWQSCIVICKAGSFNDSVRDEACKQAICAADDVNLGF